MKYIMDIETYPNFFFCGLREYKTDKTLGLEISEYVDDRERLWDMFNRIVYDKHQIITFNGNHFDNVVLNYFFKDYYRLENLSTKDLVFKLYEFGQYVINHQEENTEDYKDTQLTLFERLPKFNNIYIGDNFDKFKWYRYPKWISIDLYLFWSKLIRRSKKISLKSIACALNWNHIQELPYPPHMFLTREQIEEVKEYNLKNDLGITNELAIKVEELVNFREELIPQFSTNCLSWDGVKLGTQYVIEQIAKNRETTVQEIQNIPKHFKKSFTLGDYLLPVEFQLPKLKEYHEKLKSFKTNNAKTFSWEIVLKRPNGHYLKSVYGSGGIHSANENQAFFQNDTFQILDEDVEGLYPKIASEWGFQPINFPELSTTLKHNIEKRNAIKKTNKTLSDLLKLGNNGLVGMFKNEHSPFYSPESNLAICLNGQLLISKATELALLNNIDVFSQNTDGFTSLIKSSQMLTMEDILKEVSSIYKVKWEPTFYQSQWMLNVNNYLSLLTDGSYKAKGCFVQKDKKPLEDDHSMMIVPKAAINYLLYNKPVMETLREETDVTMFCLNIKASKKFTVEHNGVKQQNINRVLPSLKGAYLYKTGGHLEERGHMLEKSPVLLMNKIDNYDAHDYPINYNYFLSEVNKLILPFSKQQTSIF